MPPELCFQPESQLGEARGREGSELDSAARSATAFCLGHSIVGEILQAWGEKEWPEQPLASHAVCLDFPRARSSQPALFSISTYSPQNLERCVLLCSGPSFPVEQKETSIHSTNIYCTPLMRHVPGLWALGPRGLRGEHAPPAVLWGSHPGDSAKTLPLSGLVCEVGE